MIIYIGSLIFKFVIETGFLFVALWGMIKIQKLQYTSVALLGTAALGAGLDMIPWVGHYLAVPALYICLLRMTQSEFIDVVFTVMISYALTFCMNLFLLGALIGDLRPSTSEIKQKTPKAAAVPKKQNSIPEPMPTPQTAIAPTETDDLGGPPITNVFAKSTNVTPKVQKTVIDVARSFAFHGVSKAYVQPVALIHTGIASYTISLGQTVEMMTEIGKLNVTCEELYENRVYLKVGDEKVALVFGPPLNAASNFPPRSATPASK